MNDEQIMQPKAPSPEERMADIEQRIRRICQRLDHLQSQIDRLMAHTHDNRGGPVIPITHRDMPGMIYS